MRYSVNLSFVMDDQDKAKQLMAHLYTLCLQPALWSLKGHLQSEYSVIMTHAELEALPFGKSIDPVQLPSSIKVLDGNGISEKSDSAQLMVSAATTAAKWLVCR